MMALAFEQIPSSPLYQRGGRRGILATGRARLPRSESEVRMTTPPHLPPLETLQKITANVEKVMRGQSASIRKLLAAFASGGHVLLEDYPGTGKTTLAKALALSIGARFTRVQFTPDLLPSDILGVSVYDQKA